MIAELCNEGSKVFITSSASNSSRYIIPFLFFLYLLLPFVIFTRRNFPFFSTHRSIRFVFILQRTNGKFVEVVGYGKILSRMDETLTVFADFPFFFRAISSTTESSIFTRRNGLSIIPCDCSYREIFRPGVDRCFVNGM